QRALDRRDRASIEAGEGEARRFANDQLPLFFVMDDLERQAATERAIEQLDIGIETLVEEQGHGAGKCDIPCFIDQLKAVVLRERFEGHPQVRAVEGLRRACRGNSRLDLNWLGNLRSFERRNLNR